jgi:hypothetical protein
MLIMHRYYVRSRERSSTGPLSHYTEFRTHSTILDARNNLEKKKRNSPKADLFKERATSPTVSFRMFMEADFVLFLRSVVQNVGGWPWAPCSIVYADSFEPFDLFARAETDKGFARVAQLIGVSTKAELKKKYDASMNGERGRGWSILTFHASISFQHFMNYEGLFGGK